MSRLAEDFYERFSYDTGLHDWAVPNPRHEQLRLVVERVLGRRRNLRILDVGCGAGVMAGHLTSYGSVDGLDLSESAVALARVLVPNGQFYAGRPEELGLAGPYDVITLFDVLEHVPLDERRPFLQMLNDRLADAGILIVSTPRGEFTRWLLGHRPELAQAIEVEVHFADLLADATDLGLQLAYYEAYEIDFPGQYQAVAFARSGVPGDGRARLTPALQRRLRWCANPFASAVRRTVPATRLARANGVAAGVRLLVSAVPSARPDVRR
jgi:SAM-dependent methyltransferase